MKKITVIILAAIFFICLSSCSDLGNKNTTGVPSGNAELSSLLQSRMPEKGEKIAVITTNFGTIKFMFFPSEAPTAVENFMLLAEKGYYNDTVSHRIITDFMMQAGDPTGTGHGGESAWGGKFNDEITGKLYHLRGAVAMANSGANTNGSQFYIVQGGMPFSEYMSKNYNYTAEQTDSYLSSLGISKDSDLYKAYEKYGGTVWLDGGYTIFGQVFEGIDVLDRIIDAAGTKTGEPASTVRITDVKIIEYEG